MRVIPSIITVASLALGATLFIGAPSAVAAGATTQPVSDIAEHPTRSAPATAVSLNHTTLSAQIAATVESIKVGVSAHVKRGDTLLRLDCTDYQLALEQAQAGVTIAKARLTLAQSQQQRSSQLLQKELTSRESADATQADAIARQAELQQAQIQVKQAQINTHRCQVKAPFDGIITQRMANEGQLAAIGTPLITLVDTQHLELSAQIKPNEVPQLQRAQALHFVAGANFPVAVERVGGIINSETRDQEVRLIFPGARPAPGTAGKLSWQDPRPFIPARFIVHRDGQLGVFIQRQGKAHFLALPEAIPGRAAPFDGDPSTRIVTARLGQLQTGDALP